MVKKRWNGEVWFVTVEYMIDGKTYQVKEQLTYQVTKVHKVGKIPIGCKASPSLETIEMGVYIRVKYNPENPKRGYLPDNDGKYIIS